MARRRLQLALATLLSAAPAAAAPAQPAVAVTIYNPSPDAPRGNPNGFAVITERRAITLTAGKNHVRFPVPALIDPASVHLVDLTDPAGTDLVEQSLAGEVGSVDALLARSVGKPITVVTEKGEIAGTLVWSDAESLIVRGSDGQAQILSRKKTVRDVRLAELPDEVSAHPALVWTIDAKKAGEHTVEVTYQTRGLGWFASYTAVLAPNGDDRVLELGGWLAIENSSGARFENATVRLIAGDVARPAPGSSANTDELGNPIDPGVASRRAPVFRQTLERPRTLETGQPQQQKLAAATSAPAGKRVLVYEHIPKQNGYLAQAAQAYPLFEQTADGYGAEPQGQLDVYLQIANTKANGLGLALPPGELHVYRRSEGAREGGTQELVAEDRLPPTPADAPIAIKIGTTSDVTAVRKQVDFQVNEAAHAMREKIEIELKSTRKDAVEVSVVEHMYRWTAWTIEPGSAQAAPGPAGSDPQTARFKAIVPAGRTQILSYTVLYKW